MIPPGVEFQFEAKINQNILNDFKKDNSRIRYYFKDVDYSVRGINIFASQQESFEYDFFNSVDDTGLTYDYPAFINANNPNLRLGWGTIFPSKTLFLLLPDNLRKRVVKMLLGYYRPSVIFPKTRKMVKSANGEMAPPGWLKLERIE